MPVERVRRRAGLILRLGVAVLSLLIGVSALTARPAAYASTTTLRATSFTYDAPAVAPTDTNETVASEATSDVAHATRVGSARCSDVAVHSSTTPTAGGVATKAGGVGPAGARGVYDPPGGVAGQIHDYSCVAASCSMVGGGPEAYWRAAAGTTADGTRLADAASALTEGGVPSTYQTGLSIGDLEAATANGPSIVAGNGHALVVDRISGGQVFIRDPWPQGVGSSYSVSVSDFSSWWSGRAVVPGA